MWFFAGAFVAGRGAVMVVFVVANFLPWVLIFFGAALMRRHPPGAGESAKAEALAYLEAIHRKLWRRLKRAQKHGG